MTKLTAVQIQLAEQLLLSVKNHESVISYGELAERIIPPIHWRQVGRNIGEIPKLCHTAIGDGFLGNFSLYVILFPK